MSLEKYQHQAERWLQQAQADLGAAENSLAAGNHDWACFQSQQAGEKALKAVWLFHALDPWGHSLVKLIEDLPEEAIRAPLFAYLSHAKRLDKLYILTRYPNGLPDSIPAEVYTKEEADEAIRTARELVSAISRMITA